MGFKVKVAAAGAAFGFAVLAPVLVGDHLPLRPARVSPAVQLIPHGSGTCPPTLTHAGCTAVYRAAR